MSGADLRTAVKTPSERITEERTMTLNMGPQHPSTHGVLRLVVELEGEIIVSVTPHIGYLHRCAEKLGERDCWIQATVHTDRNDYCSSMTQNHAYAEAVEALAGIEVPRKARYLRVVIDELQRIASHLIWVGTTALELGAMTPFFYAFNEREKILDLFEEASGARLTYAYIRPGGVTAEPPRGWNSRVLELLDGIGPRIDQIEDLLTENPIFIERNRGIGIISGEDALALSATGPILRASGIGRDLRKDERYAAYDEIGLDVPVREEGDCYARYLVRMAEMREAARLARRAIEGMPEGPHIAREARFIRPPRGEIYSDMAKMIRHWIITIRGFDMPEGEVYRAVESPRGEVGVYLRSKGGGRPHRIHYRTPSFHHLQLIDPLSRGAYFSDLVAILSSLDPVMGETDR